MRKLIVSGAIRLSVYALTLIGAMAGSVIGAFEILPEGRALRIVLLVVACLCVVCNIWLKWQDTIEAERKEETIEDLRGKLDSQSKMMNTLMANSEPSAPTLRLVQNGGMSQSHACHSPVAIVGAACSPQPCTYPDL